MRLSWKSPLGRFANLAGFVLSDLPAPDGAPELPPDAHLWRAPYAQLLALPIRKTDADSLMSAAAIGQQWLDLSCIEAERDDHRVMDAYLLLLSEEPMPDELFATIQEIELDPTACRKHVAWPLAGEDEEAIWRRLLRVTVLGLPPSPESSGMTNSPILDSEFEKRLLEDVKELKGKAAARKHAKHSVDAP